MTVLSSFFFLRFFVYLLLERGEGREKERERNINVWEIHRVVASHTPPIWGPGTQPRHVPWLGIKPAATFWFAGKVLNPLSHTSQGFASVFKYGSLFFIKRFYLYLERGEGREKERERNISVREKHLLVASHMHPLTADWTCNPDTCPDLVVNQWRFTVWNDAQPTESHHSGWFIVF